MSCHGHRYTCRLFRTLCACLLALFALPIAFAQQPGADGLGDRLYPRLGNGGYDVQHYSIDLSFTPEDNHISATTTIDAVAKQALSNFNLDLAGLHVESVAVNAAPAAFTRVDAELIISPAQALAMGEAFSVSIAYAGVPRAIDDPAARYISLGWQEWSKGFFAAASQPSGSMNWFPCNNHPLDKATYTMRITVPQPLTAVANGTLIKVSEHVVGARTFHWEMKDPMASYLAIVAVGDFVATRDDSGPVPIRNYFPAGTEASLIAQFDITGEMMTWLIDLLGPYPFAEYGVVVVPGFPSALETQSLSIFGTLVPPERLESIILHELLHQWYGNSVTLAQWSDIWLHEGIATYFMALWTERAHGRYSYDDMIAQFLEASGSSTLAPGNLPVTELFGAASYFRGALVLHALRQAVGDHVFAEILRAFYQENAYGSANNEDFIALAQDLSEIELDDLFDAWLYGEGIPDLP